MDFDQTLLDYLDSRTGFYRMLHKMYRWALTQEELDALDEQEFRILAEELDNELMSCGFNDMYRFLRRRNTGTRQVLSADFTKVFMGIATYEGFSTQPYASLFVGSGGQRLMGSERNAVYKIYRENAVQLSQGIDLPEDHLAFECEFLSILSQRGADALAAGEDEEALALFEQQKSFVEEHVLNWLPRFYALANKMVDTRFYRGLLRVTKGFFEDEPETISDIMQDIQERQLHGANAQKNQKEKPFQKGEQC